MKKLIFICSIFMLSFNAHPQSWFMAHFTTGAGVPITKAKSYSAAVSWDAEIQLALTAGMPFGAIIKGGFVYQSSSNYTADWFKYRGFAGLNLGLGLHYSFKPVDIVLVAGGHSAKYDNSDSYFWFPYIEPSVYFPTIKLGSYFRLELGASTPMYIRADCFTFGIRFLLRISFIQGGIK